MWRTATPTGFAAHIAKERKATRVAQKTARQRSRRTPAGRACSTEASAASRTSSGTHQTQWWVQLIGEISTAVTAAQQTPQASARGSQRPLRAAQAATARPASATRPPPRVARVPGSALCSRRAKAPRRDWLSTIQVLPTREES